MYLYELGPLIAARRAKLGLSALNLAKLAGIDASTLEQLEAGALEDMSWNDAQALLRVVGVSLKSYRKSGSALQRCATTASVSHRDPLTAERLRQALRSGVIPPGFESHIAVLLDEAPPAMLVAAVEEAAQKGDELPRIWRALAEWSDALNGYRKIW
ncbi:helix-turn-helix domain-containing protein [Burkholderia cenocepacia]|uniref:helix-turn-helix domain-containing protein n=1 Tax=Burkholderia cenocepacia TaxID=95486 RepID=UPI001B9CDD0A|nr:helix-turn-helix transcriptional regulator [Burkholderia cenocepacia]MBR8029927.1 helix-turn-helix domain-containing protein [Burkholderia cenocepacia]MBR8173719.1 helix-turn-helix domain-containing protein [Burkholderia cenocepacia]